MPAIPRVLTRAASKVFAAVAPVKYKEYMELKFWKGRRQAEGKLGHGHYEHFYTDFFGLARADYVGKRVLDIGCGPRGSLEWVSAEAECVGVDPLVPEYRSLGIDEHRMRYSHAGAEKIPFPDGHFDIVASFNNLDHVDDVDKAVAEIKRVTAPGGTFLLITEVEHAATPTEPQSLPKEIASWFTPELEIVSHGICGIREDHNVYGSLREKPPYVDDQEGIVFARFIKK